MIPLLALARGLHLAGYFCSFGTIFFSAVFAPVPRRLAWGGFALALLAGAAWFLLQTADFASPQNWTDEWAAFPIVAEQTRFGALLLGRLAVLTLAMLIYQAGWSRTATALAGAGVLAESWLGHGAAMGGPVGNALLAASLLHMAGAALWLGTLPALWLALGRSENPALLRRYSRLGKACVAAILCSGAFNTVVLVGGVVPFFTTAYGLALLAKTVLLLAMLSIASGNLKRQTQNLRRAVAAEVALGLLVLLAAGVLMRFAPPAMAGMVTPV